MLTDIVIVSLIKNEKLQRAALNNISDRFATSVILIFLLFEIIISLK